MCGEMWTLTRQTVLILQRYLPEARLEPIAVRLGRVGRFRLSNRWVDQSGASWITWLGYKSERRKRFFNLLQLRSVQFSLVLREQVYINMWLAVLALLVLPLITLVYFERKASQRRQLLKEFNGPTPVPILGNANRIGKNPAGQFQNIQAWRLGSQSTRRTDND